MNPFYDFRVYLADLLMNFFSFLTDNSLVIEVCITLFIAGLILGYMTAWYKYFWRHFMFRG